jgi:NADPH-dependent 2,4-dienoyl-CoA reductase/sulfur reductase-like enzyme
MVVVVVGVRPNAGLLAGAGASMGAAGAIDVDDHMRTGLPDVFAAGDGVTTRHRLLGETWLPLGTTAHKQGRIAGENAVGGDAVFAGVLGTQVVKVFDLVAARTGLREAEAARAGLTARSVTAAPDGHKAYYPGSRPITIRLTGEAATGRLLGGQLVGAYGAEVAKRADVLATAIFTGLTIPQLSDLDLAYTPPLAAPWDAIQTVAQLWC